jgi:hypothetical protein
MPLQPIVLDFPFSKWGLDFIGIINPPYFVEYIFIPTKIDYFTKLTEVVPLKHAQDEKIISLREYNIFFHFGLPIEIIYDNGIDFIYANITQFLNKFGVKHFTSENLRKRQQTVKKYFNKKG